MRKINGIVVLLMAAATLVAGPALAHPGHPADGFAAGMLHPLTGLDHLLAMIAVGLWAGRVGGKAQWLWPATFMASMAAGYAVGIYGSAPPAELLIAASVVLLGVAAGLGLKPPVYAACAVIGVLGAAHGYAHGKEVPTLSNAFGVFLATGLLHAAGVIFARKAAPRIAGPLGLGIAAAGAALMLS